MPFEINLEPNPTVEEMRATLIEIRDVMRDLDSDSPSYSADIAQLRPIVNQYTTALQAHEWGSEPKPTSNGPVAATMSARGGNNDPGRNWAREAAKRIVQPDTRAFTSGEIGVPYELSKTVTAIPFQATRLIDLVVNRQQVTSNYFNFIRQTVRTNNAAPVADSTQKPTSVFTVADVEDRLRNIAHLSENLPNRLAEDNSDLVSWIEKEMYEGVIYATESQIVTGNSVGENFTGIINVAGVSTQAYATSVPVTLRKARTTLELKDETPNAWVLHPTDNEAIDLLTATGSGEYLVNQGMSNVFGDIRRIVSRSVPVGTALLGDFSVLKLFYRNNIDLFVDPYSRMGFNQTVMRAEWRSNVAILRPQAICVVDLTP